MSTTMINGKPRERRQLSDQIDRLDSILDGLADALNEAVADAAREGARVAVKEAIFEVLTNPELRALLARSETPAPAPKEESPTRWSKFKARLARLRAQVARAVQPVTRAVAERCRFAQPFVVAARQASQLAWRFRKVLAVGLTVGVATAVVSYEAPHSLAAALSGIGGMITAVAVQGGLWVRAVARKLAFR